MTYIISTRKFNYEATMALSTQELSKLKKLIALAQGLIDATESASAYQKMSIPSATKRIRRTGKDLAAFRKMLKAERKRGVTAPDLAKEHGVSKAYIYSLK